ncbi:transposase-like protein [Paenibacillus larvae subsp. larvae]|uniref:Transposase-like protein n=1 Tax=Paenibacillus larvae subsp. larvae TaxID=147375 RepID=A0A6C0QS55_9BACL|nr:transposase-like protein [Paenibacillus larvae subsp. larvae]
MDKQARFRTIGKMSQIYSIVMLCRIAEVSRAGYYKWKAALEARETRMEKDTLLKQHILALHRLRPYFGYKRIRTALRKEGLQVNHKKVRRLMRELGIRSVIRKKRPFAGRKPSVVFSNVLNRQFTSDTILKKFVTDITYVRVAHDFIYLSVILDLCNNEVVAWEVSSRNDLQLVVNTVAHLNIKGAILHSDQGFQYTTKTYKNLLEEKELIGSHSRRGNCFDNACIESFFSHLKTEKLYLEKPNSEADARKMIADYLLQP